MIRFRKSTVAAAAGLAALMLLPASGFAGGAHGQVRGEAPVASAPEGTRPAHMGRGPAGGPEMMAPGQDCGPGLRQGYGAGYGMGPGMMAPGIGGPDMIGPDVGKGPGLGSQMVPSKDLTADEVRDFLEDRLKMNGNLRLKVGEVKEADDDKIVADITTVDGSLVQRLEVDRHTGKMQHVQ